MTWNWDNDELIPAIDLEVETVAAGLVEICLDCESIEEAVETMLDAVAIALRFWEVAKDRSGQTKT